VVCTRTQIDARCPSLFQARVDIPGYTQGLARPIRGWYHRDTSSIRSKIHFHVREYQNVRVPDRFKGDVIVSHNCRAGPRSARGYAATKLQRRSIQHVDTLSYLGPSDISERGETSLCPGRFPRTSPSNAADGARGNAGDRRRSERSFSFRQK